MSRSPDPRPLADPVEERAVRRPYYAVRADPKIVGRVEDGGGFGIHRSWNEVAVFAWKGTERERAAMVGNYTKFQTEAEALAWLETERQDFVSKKQAQKTLRIALMVVAATLCLALGSVAVNFLYNYFGCAGDFFGTDLRCTGLKKVMSLVAEYQFAIMMAAGSGFTAVLGILVNKGINQIVKSAL